MKTLKQRGVRRAPLAAAILAITALSPVAAQADEGHGHDHAFFVPGNLVLSRTVYDNNAANVQPGEILPPGCAGTQGGCSAATGAVADGSAPLVWNNDLYDASFGITSRIFLDQITGFGWTVNTLEVPNSLQTGVGSGSDQLVTSFSSKSELALHLSTDNQVLTFMGYVAPVDTLDVSNAN